MAKYIYTDGERRYYRGIIIRYDVFKDNHWYIEVTYSIASGISKTHRHYFPTLILAKEEIDGYYRATQERLAR